MTQMFKVSAAIGMLVLAATAQAQSVYGELGYTGLTYREAGAKLSPDMFRGTLGYQFSPNVSAELMLGLGGSTKTDSASGGTLKVDNMVGAFVKLQAPLADNFQVYGRLGTVSTTLKFSGASDDGNSFAYGLGASYDITKAVYINADYTNYYDRDDQKIDGFTFGVGYRF